MKHNRLLQLIRDNATARAQGQPAIRLDTSGDGNAKVYVYDVIDQWWGASAEAFVEALQGADGRNVDLHINSPGGDVFEARAMIASMVSYPGEITAYIDGLAASAATPLAMAANQVRMTDGGLFMIHNSWTMSWGDKGELRATADLLEKVDGELANGYARQTGKALDQVKTWMDATTWFTAAEAKDNGFVDEVMPATKREASASASRWNLSAYANAPKLTAPPPTEQDPELANRVAAQLQANRNRLRLLAAI